MSTRGGPARGAAETHRPGEGPARPLSPALQPVQLPTSKPPTSKPTNHRTLPSGSRRPASAARSRTRGRPARAAGRLPRRPPPAGTARPVGGRGGRRTRHAAPGSDALNQGKPTKHRHPRPQPPAPTPPTAEVSSRRTLASASLAAVRSRCSGAVASASAWAASLAALSASSAWRATWARSFFTCARGSRARVCVRAGVPMRASVSCEVKARA